MRHKKLHRNWLVLQLRKKSLGSKMKIMVIISTSSFKRKKMIMRLTCSWEVATTLATRPLLLRILGKPHPKLTRTLMTISWALDNQQHQSKMLLPSRTSSLYLCTVSPLSSSK